MTPRDPDFIPAMFRVVGENDAHAEDFELWEEEMPAFVHSIMSLFCGEFGNTQTRRSPDGSGRNRPNL